MADNYSGFNQSFYFINLDIYIDSCKIIEQHESYYEKIKHLIFDFSNENNQFKYSTENGSLSSSKLNTYVRITYSNIQVIKSLFLCFKFYYI